MISIGEVGYEVHVHSNRNYKEFVRLDVECEEQIVKIVGGGPVTIHSSGQTTFSFTHIGGITLGACKEKQVAWVWMRLVTGLVKDRLLGCV